MTTLGTASREELRDWCDRLLAGEPAAVETCVRFLEGESLGLWHGRARAMMARRLKHCVLTENQRHRVVEAILGRLATGRFSEQFRDQLRLALCLDTERVLEVARICETAPAAHVRRLAGWVLARGGVTGGR